MYIVGNGILCPTAKKKYDVNECMMMKNDVIMHSCVSIVMFSELSFAVRWQGGLSRDYYYE